MEHLDFYLGELGISENEPQSKIDRITVGLETLIDTKGPDAVNTVLALMDIGKTDDVETALANVIADPDLLTHLGGFDPSLKIVDAVEQVVDAKNNVATGQDVKYIRDELEGEDLSSGLNEFFDELNLRDLLKFSGVDGIEDDEKFAAAEFEIVSSYCKKYNFDLSGDDLAVLDERGLTDAVVELEANFDYDTKEQSR